MFSVAASSALSAGSVRMVRPDRAPVGFLPGSGALRLPQGQIVQLHNRGPCPMSLEGRSMSDLQRFVSQVRPTQLMSSEGAVPTQPVGPHQFSPGQKRPAYALGEQQFVMAPDVAGQSVPLTTSSSGQTEDAASEHGKFT